MKSTKRSHRSEAGRQSRNWPRTTHVIAVQSFFVRTLSFTDGCFALLAMGELLRRRLRSSLASGERKCRTAQITATTTRPSAASSIAFSKFMHCHLTRGACVCKDRTTAGSG